MKTKMRDIMIQLFIILFELLSCAFTHYSELESDSELEFLEEMLKLSISILSAIVNDFLFLVFLIGNFKI